MTIRVIEWYNSHLKIQKRERERDVNTLRGNMLGLLKKIYNFILFKIYGYVVQQFLNVNINFYFILFPQNFRNENINFYFILFTQNFQVERTINWPKGNLRKGQRNFQFGWWRLGAKGRYRGCEAITWRQDSHQGAPGESPYCESL